MYMYICTYEKKDLKRLPINETMDETGEKRSSRIELVEGATAEKHAKVLRPLLSSLIVLDRGDMHVIDVWRAYMRMQFLGLDWNGRVCVYVIIYALSVFGVSSATAGKASWHSWEAWEERLDG